MVMTIKQLKQRLNKLSERHDNSEVFFRTLSSPVGNIVEVTSDKKSTYGFFGKSIPCLLISNNAYEKR